MTILETRDKTGQPSKPLITACESQKIDALLITEGQLKW